MIYIYRNPRDTMLSYLNFDRIIHKYTGTMELFADIFLEGLAFYYLPYFPHVLGYWKRRSQENLLVISYEEMQKDQPSIIRKIASFLGKEMSEEQVSELCYHTSFNQMKNNPKVNMKEKFDVSEIFLFPPLSWW